MKSTLRNLSKHTQAWDINAICWRKNTFYLMVGSPVLFFQWPHKLLSWQKCSRQSILNILRKAIPDSSAEFLAGQEGFFKRHFGELYLIDKSNSRKKLIHLYRGIFMRGERWGKLPPPFLTFGKILNKIIWVGFLLYLYLMPSFFMFPPLPILFSLCVCMYTHKHIHTYRVGFVSLSLLLLFSGIEVKMLWT